jgi:CheY-like chemotaxis protein
MDYIATGPAGILKFRCITPMTHLVGLARSQVVHSVLQQNTVSTGCISVQICHSLKMRGQSASTKKMKIFIADDSSLFVERLTELLRDVPGVEVAGQAGDVSESVRCIQQMRPDAVILDLQMPGGSGLDVLRAIRPGHPGLYVLICTNYPYPQYREECLSAGANYFLDKSAEFEKIPALLHQFLTNSAKSAPAAR